MKDKYYVDGDLNNSEAQEGSYIAEIKLSETIVSYSEMPWKIWYKGSKIDTKSKSFNFF
ncbi:MAG: hypothetical protein RR486_09520 [Clostridium sp.]|uniref:hypothetical protein n=1 Tax=Clostridium sp. TaxID=1506 RepID=UPI00305DED90